MKISAMTAGIVAVGAIPAAVEAVPAGEAKMTY
jgi:hypothetical protein